MKFIHANESSAVSSSLSPPHGIFKVSYRKVRCKASDESITFAKPFFRPVCLPTFRKSAECIEKMSSSSPPDLSLIFEHLQVSGCP